LLFKLGRERIIGQNRDQPDRAGDQCCGLQELPGGDADRAGDHELEFAAERQQREHAAEQGREREDLLGHGRGAVERELDDQGRGGCGRIAGTPHQLDEIERSDQEEERAEDAEDGACEPLRQIAAEGRGQNHQARRNLAVSPASGATIGSRIRASIGRSRSPKMISAVASTIAVIGRM
jgi:hypothetical protein